VSKREGYLCFFLSRLSKFSCSQFRESGPSCYNVAFITRTDPGWGVGVGVGGGRGEGNCRGCKINVPPPPPLGVMPQEFPRHKRHLKSMADELPGRPTSCVSSGIFPPPTIRRGHSTRKSAAACLAPGSITMVSPGLQDSVNLLRSDFDERASLRNPMSGKTSMRTDSFHRQKVQRVAELCGSLSDDLSLPRIEVRRHIYSTQPFKRWCSDSNYHSHL
jgi:hypothetical protein